MTYEDKKQLVQSLIVELNGKLDGGRKNILAEECPYCGKRGGKFGIYIGPDTPKKKAFMAHCFSCGKSVSSVNSLLRDIGRSDLQITDTISLDSVNINFTDSDNEKIDDSLDIVEMPKGYQRTRINDYLKSRGFTRADYNHFEVGTTRGLNFKYNDYVIFPIYDHSDIVGYISRHTWSKEKIEAQNEEAKISGKYEIRRYNNSRENDFSKLLYNYDSIIEDVTRTAIIVEGVFDVIALTRKLNLYNNHIIVPVATFGKKISNEQIYKLQEKGVSTVVVGYDGDAVNTIKKVAEELEDYFDVLVADIVNPEDDFDSMCDKDIYNTFSYNLKSPIEYNLTKVQT